MAITVTHRFVSPKPEQSDPTIIGPNEWNDTHIVVDSNNTYNVPDYNFCRVPGGTLTGGITNTVTLTPVPLGVNGTNVQHWLYISGGTGTAEAVLITGGTAVSGAASGTITFVPASNHTGAWNICTATAGIQEAIYFAADYSFVHLPAIPFPYYQVYAQIYLPNTKHLTIEGDGPVSIVVFNQTNANGFYLDGNPESFLYFGRMRLAGAAMTNTNYYMLYINDWSPSAAIHDLNMNGAANHIALNGQISLLNVFIGSFTNIAITGLGTRFGGTWVNVQCVNFNTGHARAGVYMNPSTNTAIDGWICVGFSVGGDSATGTGVDYGVYINPGTQYISNVEFTDCYFESFILGGFLAEVDSGGLGGGIYKFTSTRFASNGMGNNTVGIQFVSNHGDGTIVLSTIMITGCYLNAVIPIVLAGVANAVINGCNIAGPGITGPNPAIGIDISSLAQVPPVYSKNINISDNVIGYGQYGETTAPGNAFQDGPCDYAMRIDSPNHSDIVITDNILFGRSGTVIDAAFSYNNRFVCKGNEGIDDIVGSVASAAALVFPINPNFNITGTTTITSVSGLWTGRTGNFRTVGVVTFTAGATIGSGGTTTVNKIYSYYFDGVQLWILGPGF